MNETRVWLASLIAALAMAVGAAADEPSLGTNSTSLHTFDCPRDFFPIMPWGPLRAASSKTLLPANGLASMADCGFTIGGFVTKIDLRQAERRGLKVLVYPDVADPRVWTREWKTLSDQEIGARVRYLIAQGGKSKAVLGYYITDEPGASSFAALAKVVAAVKQLAPGKLAYINLFPGYATIGAPNLSQLETASFTEYLERFVNEVKPQVLSYDNYMVQYSMDMAGKKAFARYYSDLLEVRRVAQANGLSFWIVVSSNQIRPHTTVPSPANLAFQAYTTLAAGGRGVAWYTYYARSYAYAPIDGSGNKTATWRFLQGVNQQIKTLGPLMNQLESTGVFFSAPSPVDGLPQLPGRLVESIDSDAPMMLGEFKNSRNENYCMIVNLSLEKSTRFSLKTAGQPLEGQIISPEDGHLSPIDHKNRTWLAAGQGALIKLPTNTTR